MAEKEKGKRAGDERAGGSRPDDHRRKWDLAEYEKAAKAREDVEKAMNRYCTEGTVSLVAILPQADARFDSCLVQKLFRICAEADLDNSFLSQNIRYVAGDNCVMHGEHSIGVITRVPLPRYRIQIRCRVQI